MLVRIWETRFDIARKAELVAYANEVSLPVLKSRSGCNGVLFLALDDCWITQTIWDDRSSIDTLDEDTEYARIVEGILALNVLGPDQSTKVYEIAGGSSHGR
jgi:hypothetical protein